MKEKNLDGTTRPYKASIINLSRSREEPTTRLQNKSKRPMGHIGQLNNKSHNHNGIRIMKSYTQYPDNEVE